MNHPNREDVEISQYVQSDQQVSSEPPVTVESTSPLPEDTHIPLSQPSSTLLRERALRYLERKRIRQEYAQEYASAQIQEHDSVQIQAIKTSTDAIKRVPIFSPDKSDSYVKIPHFASSGNELPEEVGTRFIASASPFPFASPFAPSFAPVFPSAPSKNLTQDAQRQR